MRGRAPRSCLKCENLQRVGAFKFRGAWNAVSRLTPAQRERGVIAYSSGNHAQAVALAGRLLGVATTIVMPADGADHQARGDRAISARRCVPYDPATESREAVAAALQAAHG